MKLAVAQMTSDAGDFLNIKARVLEFARQAHEQDARLVIFPLCTVSGTGLVSAGDAEPYANDLAGVLGELAEELPLPVLLPIVVAQDEVPYLDAALIKDGTISSVRLAGGNGEKGIDLSLVRSSEVPVIDFEGQKIAVAFTYEDINNLIDNEVETDIVVYLSAYGFSLDDPGTSMACSLEKSGFVADAAELDAWFVGVGSVGCYNLQVFCGSSFVLTPWKELAAQAPAFEEALLVCDVDTGSEGPLAAPQHFQVTDKPLVAWEALTFGLSHLVRQLGATGVALYVNQSLESQILAAAATDALGPTRVTAFLPAEEQKNTADTPMTLVSNLRLNCSFVETANGLDPAAFHAAWLSQVATYADKNGLLALSCLDKTMLSVVGARTLESGFVMPLADIYKSDLLILGHFRNTISPVIPYASRNAWRLPYIEGLDQCGSTDEACLEYLDSVIRGFVEYRRPLNTIADQYGHPQVVKTIIDRVRRNLTLMRGRPVCLPMSSRSLSEARGPVGNVWQDVVREKEETLDIEEAIDALRQMLAEQGGELDVEGMSAAAAQAATDPEQVQKDLQEILGYIKDFALDQGLAEQGGEKSEGEGGPGAAGSSFFDGPFSEN